MNFGAALKGSKVFQKFSQFIRDIFDLKNFVQKLKQSIVAGKNSMRAKICKIFANGQCFVEGTPVLIANSSFKNLAGAFVMASTPIVSTPIKDIQLFDYILAHRTINSTYGLTASVNNSEVNHDLIDKDIHTSDEQRERDNYLLDENNWNEVVFE